MEGIKANASKRRSNGPLAEESSLLFLSISLSLSISLPSSNCMQPRRIAYGIPAESHTAGAREVERRAACTYVGESTMYYGREEESRNRKRFTTACPAAPRTHRLVEEQRERERVCVYICMCRKEVGGRDKKRKRVRESENKKKMCGKEREIALSAVSGTTNKRVGTSLLSGRVRPRICMSFH